MRGAVVLFLFAASLLAAQAKFTAGTFVMDGGSYTIMVTPEKHGITVVEPNRTTPYKPSTAHPGSYEYYHDGFKKTYYMKIVNSDVLEATSTGSGTTTVLRRTAAGNPAGSEHYQKYMKLAEKYREMAIAANPEVQAWAFCSATALSGALKTEKEFNAYALEAATSLKLIAVDPGSNPCSDVIPNDLWNRAGTN